MATGVGISQALEAVVLAAGEGRRFGGGKLLAPWRGGVLLDGALAAAFSAPVRAVTVVTGAQGEQVVAAARAFAAGAGQSERLRLVHAPDHGEGMGASLRAAIAALPPDAEAAFVFLGDMPRVPHGLAAELAAAPRFEGRRGNPVLVSRALFPALRRLAGDEGARRVLQGLGERLALVDAADDGVLFDVDEPGQLPP